MDPWSEAVIRQNRRWLLAYVVAQTGDPVAADDVVQEVLAIAYEKRRAFEPGTNFGGWLRGIARNVVRRHFQSVARAPSLGLERDTEALSRLEAAAARGEERTLDPGWVEARLGALRACLEELTEKVRWYLQQRYGRGRGSAEVAAEAGTTVSAVNVAVYRARTALAECIRRRAEGPGRPA